MDQEQGREAVEQQATFAVSGEVTAAGAFEVMAITAGDGNGWTFGEDTLRESLALWDGAECFVDHAWFSRSVRDLAGVLYGPVWDAEKKGVRCKLRTLGPSGPILSELGKQMLAEGETARQESRCPRIGFSADVVFTALSRKVQKILRVNAVDLVFNPARGGAFLRALNSVGAARQEVAKLTAGKRSANSEDAGEQSGFSFQQGSEEPSGNLFGGYTSMADEKDGKNGQQTQQGQQPVVQHLQNQVTEDLRAVQTLLDVQRDQQKLEQEAQAARAVRAQMCGYLLDSGLAAAKLPGPVAERIRKQFAGKVFEPTELTQAIDDGRAMVSELTGAGTVAGVGRVHGMFSSEDQFTAAVHDLLGAERPKALEGIKTARLQGIRELYTLMTGDIDFVGGFNQERVQFSTTADLPGVLANVLNKLVAQEWQELGKSGYRWWEPIVAREHFTNLQALSGLLVGEVGVLPVVAEGGPYTELPIEDNAESAAWVKYGGYIGLTLEMFERDETRKMKIFPKKLASSGLRRISNLVANVFLAGGGLGPVMSDAVTVFAAAHGNLGAVALASASWEAASSAIYNQPMLADALVPDAPVLALDAKYLIVPRALRLAGWNLLYPSMEHTVNIHSENMQRGEMGDVITCPEFSDANDWAAVADPRLAPAIIVADRFGLLPEIIIADQQNNGALFTNDEIRMKARHWLAVLVADYRPLYKANVV